MDRVLGQWEYRDIISDYDKSLTEDNKLIQEYITSAQRNRVKYDTSIYKEINNALQGNVSEPGIDGNNSLDLMSNEAYLIMKSKAAAFDTSALNIELKPLLKEQNTEESANSTELISIFNKYLNSYLSVPKFDFVFADAIKSSRAYPMAVTLIGWDDNIILGNDTENLKGDITCENIALDEFWWDPAATNIEGCEYVFITRIYSPLRLKRELKKTYKSTFREDLFDALIDNKNNLMFHTFSNNMGPNTLSSKNSLIDNGGIPMTQLFRKHYDEKDKRIKIKIDFILADKYIIASSIWDIEMLPFAIIKEEGVPNSFTGISSVMLSLSKIKQINSIDKKLSNIVESRQGETYLINGASGIDGTEFLERLSNGDTVAIVTNGDLSNSIKAVEPAPIEDGLLIIKNSLKMDMEQISSAADLINGITDSTITGAATRAKISQEGIKENTSVTELKKYLVRFVSIVIEFMKKNWFKSVDKQPNPRFLRSKNNESGRGDDAWNFFEFKKEDLEYIIADVDIDCNLLRSSRKEKQQADLINLYQIGLQYKSVEPIVTIEEIIDVLNIPNKDIILERIKKDAQENKIARSVSLVETVIQALQNPEYASIPIEQLVISILQQSNVSDLPTDEAPQEEEL